MSKYPPPKRQTSGCKVAWYVYDNEETAREAAATASLEAAKLRGLGYDFGHLIPGTIEPVADGFRVVVP